MLEVELTDLPEQANGAALVKYGETVVLVTAVMSKKIREGIDFFPLLVDFEEKFYAAGKILGGRFMRREARPSEEAILSARLIDRTIRPLFNDKIRNDVQIVATVLSFDEKNDPDTLGILAASTSLMCSDIPWNGAVGAVKVGMIDGKFVLNPTYEEKQKSDLELLACGVLSDDGKDILINMIETGAKEVPENKIIEAFEFAKKPIGDLIKFQEEILKTCSVAKVKPKLKEDNELLKNEIQKFLKNKLEAAIYIKEKMPRVSALEKLKEEMIEFIKEKHPEDESISSEALYIFDEIVSEVVHRNIIENEKRPDGRALDELREITCEVGILPRLHGTGLFIRGTTKALSVLTLGSPSDEQLIEGMEVSEKKRFMHHYNFPPYSVGEVAPMRGPGRREIGHGALAEKALEPLIPSKEKFPYTIRLVSEILSSNGSSSMASVCGSILALMDGGVPIKKPAAGIAMGFMSDEKGNYKILTDIQGPEDHYGDMDFKAAGTADGLTAIQMDVKIKGVTIKTISEILQQARKARLEILEKMLKVLPKSRTSLSKYAPKIETIKIDPEKIRDVIGPQGKVINEIIAKTGAAIDIEQDGLVFVTAVDEESVQKAVEWIKNLTHEVKVGEVFKGKITRILDFGAFAEILPGQEGLIHISQLAHRRVNRVEDVVKLGDVVPVKVIGIDELGRINLSLKEMLPKEAGSDNYKKHDRNRKSFL